jgi:pyruvate/2-oxoglutarate dehydrogenase complex dihydrolipoamide dehydrogenase (E3) component
MSYLAGTSEGGETSRLMTAIGDAGTGEIVGAALLGIEGGELMSMLEIAMMAHLPYTALREAVFAHPTLAEGLNTLFTSME